MAPSPGTPNAPSAGAPTESGGGGGNVREAQNGIRRLPLSDKLRNVLQSAARAAGVDVVVTSGGQPAYPKGPRTGSTRHDLGNAADLDLYVGGRILSDANPADIALKKKFVDAAAAGGASGIGAGYMGPTKIHVGFGSQALWGGAPWLKGTTPGSGAAEGSPVGVASSSGVQQGRTVAAGSTARAMEENMNAMPGRVVIMNNNRLVSQTRTIVRGGSVPMDRPGTRDVNPLNIVAGVAAGYAFGKALRLF